jgi:hypothetical protein
VTRSTIGYKPRRPGSLDEVLSRAFAQAGGVKAVADVLPGRTAKRLYEAASPDADPSRDTHLMYAEARLLTRAMAGRVTAMAEDMALLAGGVFLPALNDSMGTVGAQAGRFGREVGEAMAAVYSALEDGRITRAEAEEALPQVREAMEAAAELYRLLEAIIHSPTPSA